jgi:GT2 family glycosyltransferase
MYISVIVATLNRLGDLKLFIRSLEKQSYPPLELVIVDQSDNGQIKEYINGYLPSAPFPIKYVFTNDKSLTRAKNLGVVHLSEACNLVAFFDDDIVLFSDYLERMNDFFQRDNNKHYAVATGMIHREDPRNRDGIESSWRLFAQYLDVALSKCFILSSVGNGCFKINGLPAYLYESGSVRDVEVISGGVSVFRREILEQFKFDGNMKTYCYMEDVDMGYRISRQYQNVFLPTAKVYHHHSETNRLNRSTAKSQLIQNYVYLFRKNIPKNVFTFSAFIWSIIGLFSIAACELQFRSFLGYAVGLGKGMLGRYDSLFPDWQDQMSLYK